MQVPPSYASNPHAPKRVILVVVPIAVVLAVAVGATLYLARQEATRLAFTYSVELELNGTGIARVSLPIPTDPRFLAGLAIAPISSVFALNESGSEPSLDVTFDGTTWLNATWRGAGTFEPQDDMNLTRTDPNTTTCQTCVTEIALAGLLGNVTSVQIRMFVSWSDPCWLHEWRFQGWVQPGVHTYNSWWGTAVC